MSKSSQVNLNPEKIGDALLTLAGVVCLLLPVILLVVVILRAIIPAGIPMWSLDACELLMWFPTYLALGYTWRTGHHVRVTVFSDKIQGKKGLVLDMIILSLCLLITLVLVYAGVNACLDSWVEGKRTYSELPEYYFSLAIPVGLIYLVYEVTATLKSKFNSLLNGKV